MDFQNRVVVVTGGANGIGRATVESFLAAGAAVAFVDTDKEAGQKIVSRFATNDVYSITETSRRRLPFTLLRKPSSNASAKSIIW